MELKIGYVPYSRDLTQVADRRRFPCFAGRNNIYYEVADFSRSYDLIILPAPSNLTKWLQYKRKNPRTVFVFEMVDSLIHQKDWMNLLIKGTGRFLIGKESRPTLIHRNLLIRWIKEADIVICSNRDTQRLLKQWNKNVLFNLDYQENEYKFLKTDYEIKGKMKLFWEGQGVVLPQLSHFKEVLANVSSFCELHIVSSASFPVFGTFFHRNTTTFLKRLPIETHFHLWNQQENPQLFSMFDCGIIPISKKDGYAWHKPANKLISFWFSGIPTLTSDTPAYCEIASRSANDFICTNGKEWIEKINWIRNMSADERKRVAIRNYEFAKNEFSNKAVDPFWTELLKLASDIFSVKKGF